MGEILFGKKKVDVPAEKKPDPDLEKRRLAVSRSRSLLDTLNRGLKQLTFSGSNIRTGSN